METIRRRGRLVSAVSVSVWNVSDCLGELAANQHLIQQNKSRAAYRQLLVDAELLRISKINTYIQQSKRRAAYRQLLVNAELLRISKINTNIQQSKRRAASHLKNQHLYPAE